MLTGSLSLLLLAAAAPAGAQGPGDVAANPDSALAAALAQIGGEPIALDDALARALGAATSLKDAEAGVRAAEGALRRENGAFDPVLFAGLDYRDEDVQTASPFAGADVLSTQSTSGRAGARWMLPLGTELEARLESVRLKTNSEFAALNPEYSTQGRLEIRQPLLRGFGPAAGGERASARRDREAARARLSEAALAVESDVTGAYWDLYAAERDLAVQRLIVRQAEALLEQARHRADAGLVGPSEVATARVFLTEQRLAEIDREESVDQRSDRLGFLMGAEPADPSGRYRPVSEPPRDIPVEAEEALLERAMAWNGELRAAREELAGFDERTDAARWNALPTLDVVGSVGGNGLTGESQPVTFGTSTTTVMTGDGYAESVSEALKRDAPTWAVGVTLEVPIGFREGRGEKDRLDAERERARQRVVEQERLLREEVRARHRELDHGVRRLDLARAGVDASLEQVRIGEIEYENGRTTAFELVRLGADLAAAQERYSAALVRTAKAAAELRRLAPREDR